MITNLERNLLIVTTLTIATMARPCGTSSCGQHKGSDPPKRSKTFCVKNLRLCRCPELKGRKIKYINIYIFQKPPSLKKWRFVGTEPFAKNAFINIQHVITPSLLSGIVISAREPDDFDFESITPMMERSQKSKPRSRLYELSTQRIVWQSE